MATLPVPSGWPGGSERVEICSKCGRPDYDSRMHVTHEGNLECDLHGRTAGLLNALNLEKGDIGGEEEGEWQRTPHSIPSSR